MGEFEREELQEQERQRNDSAAACGCWRQAIRFDELALNGEAAAAKLRLIAEVEGVSGPDAVGAFSFDRAGEFYERGDRKGEKRRSSMPSPPFARR